MSTTSKYEHLVPRITELRKKGLGIVKIANELGIPKNSLAYLLHVRGDFAPIGYQPKFDVDTSTIDRQWQSEFAGFFMGEGSVYISTKNDRKNRTRMSLCPVITIAVRIDEKPLIDDIHSKLKGNTSIKQAHGASNTAAVWSYQGWKMYPILLMLLNSSFPAKKIRDVQIMKEACDTRFRMSYALNKQEYEELFQYRIKLQQIKLLR